MPSFRVTLGVGVLAPGVAPQDVLPAAAQAARDVATVEAYDVGIVRGQARVTVRFTAADDAEALGVGARVRATVARLAEVRDPRVTRRWGSRWEPVRTGAGRSTTS